MSASLAEAMAAAVSASLGLARASAGSMAQARAPLQTAVAPVAQVAQAPQVAQAQVAQAPQVAQAQVAQRGRRHVRTPLRQEAGAKRARNKLQDQSFQQ